MINLPIFDLDLAKQTEIDQQLFRVLSNNFLQLLKYIVKYNLAGLLLQLSQFGYGSCVEFNGGEGEIDLVLHLHAVFD